VNILLFKTQINLPEMVRERMVKLLNQQLADSLDLRLQARHAQWNIGGPQFLALHLLCDQIANEMEETTDEIAGRVTLLGGMALGTKQSVAEASRLPEYPSGISSADQHMAALCRALESFAVSVREAAGTACDEQDFDSTDTLAHVSQTTDKLLWMVQSYLQRRRPGIGEAESNHSSAHEGEAA
jgi:starvation-inducible DNA-binding protein